MTKAHILEEISRTAKANGGVPLGWRKFFTETGIKESDWLGKHWARWSDALAEAGFAKNQLQIAYADTALFDKYIALARDLGRLPTSNDLRFRARKEKGFPSAKTFEKRGAKSEFVAKLHDYCAAQGFEDVVQWCVHYESGRGAEIDEEMSDNQEAADGFVYLVKSGRFHKIGRSNASGRRAYEMKLQLPEKTDLVHEIRTDDPVGIEAYWHKRFEAHRKNGEWFTLSVADIQAFKRRKFM